MARNAIVQRRPRGGPRCSAPALPPLKPPAHLGEYRNIYRRADGTERHSCTWRDQQTEEAAREILPGETFVETRDMRDATDMAPTGAPAVLDG